MGYWLTAYFSFSTLFLSVAQVPNDNIADRIELQLNVAVNSNTIGSTVEWKCLNQDLTRSCIKYHNDQWFEFTAPMDQVFINISGQDCKDIWGVQLLVFSGVPCEPSTYELLTCYSEGNKDDVFVRLTNLIPGKNYLVNVDGYLHDLCSFNIELSDEPHGLPVAESAVGNISSDVKNYQVTIRWEIPGQHAEKINEYEVWRRTGDVYKKARTIPHARNTFGAHQLSYSATDSIGSMEADYIVVAAGSADRYLVGKTTVELDYEAISMLPENLLDVELSFKRGDPVSLELWDMEGDRLLKTYDMIFDPDKNATVSFRIMEYRRQGVTDFKVVIRNNRTGDFELRLYEK